MQTALKICFWFSVIFAVTGSYLLGDPTRAYLITAVFALPGLFIQNRRYQLAAGALCCLALVTAYAAYQRDLNWKSHIETIIRDADAKRNPGTSPAASP